LKHTVTQYPKLLTMGTDFNFLFSPNFERYIDVEYISSNFVIKSVDPNIPTIVIPNDLISLEDLFTK